jgi:hypothetical protein
VAPTYISDIASPYQHGLSLAALRPDCAGVEIKCTQGAGYWNPDYPGWLASARADGLIPVAYHYVDGAAPAAQAANLASRILDISVPVMLDAEDASVGLAHTMQVADAMTAQSLRVQLLYGPRSWWQRIGSPDLSGPLGARKILLINAAYASSASGSPAQLYPGDNAAAWNPYGGVTPTLIQFTDRAAEGGYLIDMNAYRGTPAALATLLASTPAAPVVIPVADAVATAQLLVVGMWGPRVTAMQEALTYVNCPCGPPDGRFGGTTRAGVELFQVRYGLQRDGEYGSESAGRMAQRVEQIQRALTAAGFDPGLIDGIPGPNTKAATRRAQATHHLVQDAIVGPDTSHALGITYP